MKTKMKNRFAFLKIFKKPVVILSTLLIIFAAGFVYYFVQYSRVTKNPTEEARIKTEKVVDEIAKLMVISDRSNAVLATITDKSKLAGQKFFDVAENGDDLVLFPAMMKAVLYRPSLHKIIDVGPFTPNGQATNATNTSQLNTAAPVKNTPASPATKTTTASSTKSK